MFLRCCICNYIAIPLYLMYLVHRAQTEGYTSLAGSVGLPSHSIDVPALCPTLVSNEQHWSPDCTGGAKGDPAREITQGKSAVDAAKEV